jgi:DNA polymerase-3 subunit epsilon
VARQRPVPIARRLTEADLVAHRELVKSLGPHPLWNEYLAKVEG